MGIWFADIPTPYLHIRIALGEVMLGQPDEGRDDEDVRPEAWLSVPNSSWAIWSHRGESGAEQAARPEWSPWPPEPTGGKIKESIA